MTALHFERSDHDRLIAGVCGGLAERMGVDATLVRLVFAVLALAGGAGILLYFALWVYAARHRRRLAALLVAASVAALLDALGFSTAVVIGGTLVIAGLIVVLARGGSVRSGGSMPVLAVTLLVVGAVVLLGSNGSGARTFIGPGAIVGMLLLIVGPWVWRLQSERAERIRLEERASVAARVHDSVLQTLALVQRHADDPARVAALARRQERELRRWLYGSGVDATTLDDALADSAADVEQLHRVRVELASAGDLPLDERLEQVVLAAREAMTNAAKFAGVDEISVYAEVDPGEIAVFVRDRGVGFDPATVTRRGIAESIEGRLRQAGGTATVTSSPGDGTEVELRLPR